MKFFLIILLCYIPFSFGAPEIKELNLSFDDFTVIPGNNPPQKEEEKIEPKQEEVKKIDTNKDGSVSGFDQIKESLGGVINSGVDKVKTRLKYINTRSENRKLNKKKRKKEKTPKYPDPFFYDAIYTKEEKFYTYAYIYNDKQNRDNNYIPQFYKYDVTNELFKLAKSRVHRSQFYALYNTTRNNKNFNIDAQDRSGNTLLLTALYNGNFEIFFFLITQGANVNLCNDNNICPIHLAVYSDNFEVIKSLCEHDVDVRVKDKNGTSMLEYAIYQRNNKAILIMLTRYLSYPINYNERLQLIDFTKSVGMKNLANKIENMFGIYEHSKS